MSAKYHINPRFRAYGKARLDVTLRAKDEREWREMWKEPLNSFPFNFGSGWKFCFEYKVEDFAAEVGFFIDVLGFSVRAFSPRYAQFTSPGEELCLIVRESGDGVQSTDPDMLRLHLQLSGIDETIGELEFRGIAFEKSLNQDQDGISVLAGYFRTPHGLRIDLWNQPPFFQEEGIGLEDEEQVDSDDMEGYNDLVENDDLSESDDPIDEHDDDETDRMINELLGLSANDPHMDEILKEKETSAGEDQEYLEYESSADEESSIEDHPVRDIQQTSMYSKNRSITQRKTTSWNKPEQSRLPANVSKSRNLNWPTDDDRRNGELSYEEIDDE
jgi:hypothetical protein